MDKANAISLVVQWIRSHHLDYPTTGLDADPFEVGWSVYAPVEVDESDPMAFLDMPVGRSVFLVSHSGRIKEVSSSMPPQQAEAQFIAEERGAQQAPGGSGEAEFMAEFQRAFQQAAAQGSPVHSSFNVVSTPPDEATAAEASRLIDPIVQQLAQLGPPAWHRFHAEFAFTASAEVAQLRFWSDGHSGLVPVPETIAELVRRQRHVAARMPAGPWWRLLLTVSNRGETTVEYDYGDEPFPDDQLLRPEHYRNDLATYPRPRVPVWLAGYVAGHTAQGRPPHLAQVSVPADAAAGRGAGAAPEIPALRDIWARWAVLSAAHVGVGSDWGPRIHPGYAWYESDRRSGSTLFVLPGERAVLSGGRWNSPLLDAAYNGPAPLPALYVGAPAWVTDSVLNTRNRNGLLTFCFWWTNGQWLRGATDTSDELDGPLPAVRTPEDTVRAMASQTGAGTGEQCLALLTAATQHSATPGDVAAILPGRSDAEVASAIDQLSLAGVLSL